MATKSITKSVVMRTKPLARNFIKALESAEGKQSKPVTYDRPVNEVKGEKLQEIFKK